MNQLSLHTLREEHAREERVTFGFWVYLMSDCLLFACLFATYAVLHNNTYGGESAHELFNLPFVFVETLILLTSSFVTGLMNASLHAHKKKAVLITLFITALLGSTFLYLEFHEFSNLIADGNSFTQSAFLTAFFTLVGTHGLHVLIGTLFMVLLMIQVWGRGITPTTARRLKCLALFWHFLDIIWIFIFTFVYLY